MTEKNCTVTVLADSSWLLVMETNFPHWYNSVPKLIKIKYLRRKLVNFNHTLTFKLKITFYKSTNRKNSCTFFNSQQIQIQK